MSTIAADQITPARPTTDTVPSRFWEANFIALREFAAIHGHARPSRAHQTADGLLLGAWVVRQRTAYDKGALAEDRAHRLDALPGWVWRPESERRRSRVPNTTTSPEESRC
ncbi:hypothetical protein MARA_03030 (plasmid) [Mycolicibacterium arabiense]|uniref:Helicase-associated domain-containing protein n=1 Tax=Mycolicibacterium arabiense TaxID=1286181 RepID=A0A7I7RQS4_9MYCO|nr:helicase associated domain-containing protein [Mycolicibacterium arabiense]BBY46873.1 hypothetical protein MARA_03030 [Mycolicibacterium arabiense]